MFGLPQELNDNIFNFLAPQDNYNTLEFWTEFFNNKVLSILDPKGYFSKYVLADIDLGYRLCSKAIIPCATCYYSDEIDELTGKGNINCTNCSLVEPCINCYWYNNTPTPCFCQNELIHISWKQVRPFLKLSSEKNNSYDKYRNFLKSVEWKEQLKINNFYMNELDFE